MHTKTTVCTDAFFSVKFSLFLFLLTFFFMNFTASVSPPLQLKQMYAAQSQLDENYYRCQIENFNADDSVTVRFIDYGNTERIPNSAVKELKEQFKLPLNILTRKMFLPIQFIDENASLIDFDWTIPKRIEILGTYQEYFVCKLTLNGHDLFETMIAEGKVKSLSLEELSELIEQQYQVMEISAEEEVEQPIQNEVETPPVQQQQPVAIQQPPTPTQQPPIPTQQQPPQPLIKETTMETLQKSPDSGMYSEVSTDSSQITVINQSAITSKSTETELVFLTHVDHPNRFFIQLNDDIDEINSFGESLQIVAPQLPALTDFRAGQLCIAKYTIDDKWYRARIIDSDGDITSIQFIDYGNTDSITDNTLLKSMIDPSLIERKPFAITCSLPIAPRGSSEWAESACKKLNILTQEPSPMEYELVSKDKNVNYVKLFFVGGRDLVKELIQEEVAEPLEIIQSGEKCYVSHINSLSDFFIQVESDLEVLAKIEQHLVDSESIELNSPAIGTICRARFEDDLFYRGLILNILPDGKYDVEFLDYGNTFQTSEVRTLDPEIAQLPHLRKRCSLNMPNNVECWSDEAEHKFREISKEGATEFKVTMMKPGKNACIELHLDDQNLTEILGELCVKNQASLVVSTDEFDSVPKIATSPQQQSVNITDFPSGKQICYFTHIESPAEFYIQFESKSGEISLIQNELHTDQPMLKPIDVTVGSVIAALYDEDEQYYRAKVLEKTENDVLVKFIDYGNTCKVTQLKKLSSIISTIIPLAAQCTLTNDRLQQFTEQEKNVFINFMAETPEPTFQVESIGITSGTKTTVTFYRNDMEILDYIRAFPVATDVLTNIVEQAVNIPQ